MKTLITFLIWVIWSATLFGQVHDSKITETVTAINSLVTQNETSYPYSTIVRIDSQFITVKTVDVLDADEWAHLEKTRPTLAHYDIKIKKVNPHQVEYYYYKALRYADVKNEVVVSFQNTVKLHSGKETIQISGTNNQVVSYNYNFHSTTFEISSYKPQVAIFHFQSSTRNMNKMCQYFAFLMRQLENK